MGKVGENVRRIKEYRCGLEFILQGPFIQLDLRQPFTSAGPFFLIIIEDPKSNKFMSPHKFYPQLCAT